MENDNVVSIGCQTTRDLSPEQVLTAALTANLTQVVIIGWNDTEPYHAATTSDVPEILFRLEMFKRELLEQVAARSGAR